MASAVSGDDLIGQVSATIAVLDIYPQIMREKIHIVFPPKGVSRQIKNEVNQTFMKRLTPKERGMISKLDSDGYNDLDLPCLYKVIRYFKLLPPPTKGWGQRPQPEDQSEGDDIERMNRHHNDIIHRPRASLTESERNIFFQESIEIAKRMDNIIGSSKNGFESRIQNVQSNLLSQEKYVEALEKIAEYQGSLQEVPHAPSYSLYFGNDIKIELNEQEEEAESSSSCTIFSKDPSVDVKSIIQQLEAMQECLLKNDIVFDEDRNIPEQIRKMDKESVNIYMNALKSGSERRRDINLIIVGKKGVGKTSLVRRLFAEKLDGVKKTNGIEIHRRRCRINLSDWEWKKVPDTTTEKEKSINKRILQIMINMIRDLYHGEERAKQTHLETSVLIMTETDDNKDTESSIVPQTEIIDQLAIPEITEPPVSELARNELLSLIESDIDLQDEDSYATLTVWDFAGDIEYYNTHQTFLNPEAIFLVVANLHNIDDTESYS